MDMYAFESLFELSELSIDRDAYRLKYSYTGLGVIARCADDLFEIKSREYLLMSARLYDSIGDIGGFWLLAIESKIFDELILGRSREILTGSRCRRCVTPVKSHIEWSITAYRKSKITPVIVDTRHPKVTEDSIKLLIWVSEYVAIALMPEIEYDSMLSSDIIEEGSCTLQVVEIAIISYIYISWGEALCDDRLSMPTETESHIEDTQRSLRMERPDTRLPLRIEELDDGSEEDTDMRGVHEKNRLNYSQNIEFASFFSLVFKSFFL